MDGLVHAGTGSDLMALCGKMYGISGHDQVRRSYVDDRVTCADCLQVKVRESQKRREGRTIAHSLILARLQDGIAAAVIVNGVTIYHEDDDKGYSQSFTARDVATRLSEALKTRIR
jgi:hypothetical protein